MPTRMKVRRSALWALLLLAAPACGGDDGGTGPDTEPPVASSVAIAPGATTLTAIGDTKQFNATVLDQNGAPMASAAVGWSSLDAAVATVSTAGEVAAGEARIVATAGAAADTAAVTVALAAADLVIQPPFGELHAIGDSIRLEAAVRDRNGNAIDGAAVEWTSVDTAVATVDADGWVVATGAGTARIRATAGALMDEAAVVVSQVAASVTLMVPDDTLAEGESVQLAAVVADSNGVEIPDARVTWATSDSTAATVDAGGRVTAVWGEATATLTAAAGGASAEAEIAVLGKIVFQSSRTGETDIYLMNTDGSGLLRLTSSDSTDSRPVWSPDGNRIAFASNRDGNNEIYVMNADGSGAVRLTDDPADDHDPAWSPDGSKVGFESDRDGNYDLYAVNADGTGTPVQLTTTEAPDVNASIAWSPDGSRIAFTRYRGGDYGIWVANADGSGPTDLTPGLTTDVIPLWTPDGSRILFTSQRDGNLEVYVMSVDGSNPVRLTTDSASDAAADWRPRP